MARKKKRADNIYVHGIAERGKAVGRLEDGQVIFLDHAVPGDTVDCVIIKRKKSFLQAKVLEVKESSTHRTKPFCKHFNDCGGCKWQDMTYGQQIAHKHKQVVAAISKLAKVETEGVIENIIGAKHLRYYRNKMEYSFSHHRWIGIEEAKEDVIIERTNALGFHPPGFYNKVVDIKACHLQDGRSNTIRNGIRAFSLKKDYSYYDTNTHTGLLRNMIVRNSSIDEWMLIMIFGEDKPDEIQEMMSFVKEEYSFLDSIYYIVNLKKNDTIFDQTLHHYEGQEYIHEILGDVKYKISPKSFFQTNSSQAKVLYDKILEYAKLKPTDHVYDLYTGLGSIALYVSKFCASVLGIEEIEMAIEDAHFNAKLNNIQNADFYAGDVKDVLTEEFIAKHPKPDVVITDPPRAGMHQNVVNTLLELKASRIVYVSCNPSTQARDIALLKEVYNLIKLTPVDMFPHTHHVESVALLELK